MYNGNFYNPYNMFQSYQTARNIGAGSLGIRSLFKNFSFNGFLNSTGKTLNVINQAIPIFYQIRPILNNAKTMFRVLGAVRDTNTVTRDTSVGANNVSQNYNNQNTTSNINTDSTTSNNASSSINNPAFFL